MKKIFYILLFYVIASPAFAQDAYVSWQYSMGFGSGNLHEYISPASFRGVTFNVHKFVSPNVTLGMEAGWNVFYEKMPFDSYTYRDATYSGKQSRYSKHFPILATVNYFMNVDAVLTPFAGFGLGTMYSLRNTDMSTYTFESDAWHFAIKPELGLMYNFDDVSFLISSKYYHGFKAGDLPAQGYFTINVGLVFSY
jgi:hypothetical protein